MNSAWPKSRTAEPWNARLERTSMYSIKAYTVYTRTTTHDSASGLGLLKVSMRKVWNLTARFAEGVVAVVRVTSAHEG